MYSGPNTHTRRRVLRMTPLSRFPGCLLSHDNCCHALHSGVVHSRLVQASILKASGLTEKKIRTIEHRLLNDSETKESRQDNGN